VAVFLQEDSNEKAGERAAGNTEKAGVGHCGNADDEGMRRLTPA